MLKFTSTFLLLSILSSCAFLQRYVPTNALHSPVRTSSKQVLWSKNLDPIYNSGNLPIALNAPAISDGIVYIGDGQGIMHAFNITDGREIWQSQDVGTYHARPVFFDDMVIYGTVEGRIYARNKLTGEQVYSVALGSAVESAGTIADGIIFFLLRGHQLVALDVKTGKLLWSYKRAVPYLTTLQGVTTPVVFQDRVYVGFADSYFVAFSRLDGNILWERKLGVGQKFIDVDITPTLFKGAFATSASGGPLVFIDPKSGIVKLQLEIFPSSSPLLIASGLLVGTVSGELVLIDNDYRVVFKRKISSAAISTLISWKGAIYAGTTDGHLYELSSDGKELKQSTFLGSYASAIFRSPAVTADYMALFSSRYRLYLIR